MNKSEKRGVKMVQRSQFGEEKSKTPNKMHVYLFNIQEPFNKKLILDKLDLQLCILASYCEKLTLLVLNSDLNGKTAFQFEMRVTGDKGDFESVEVGIKNILSILQEYCTDVVDSNEVFVTTKSLHDEKLEYTAY